MYALNVMGQQLWLTLVVTYIGGFNCLIEIEPVWACLYHFASCLQQKEKWPFLDFAVYWRKKCQALFFCNRAVVPSLVPCRLRRVDLNEVWLGHYQLSSAIPLRNAKLILSADIWICPVQCIYTKAAQQCLWFPRACSTAIWNCYWLRIAR